MTTDVEGPQAGPKSSNQAKFETGNPVVRGMIDRFFEQLTAIVEPIEASSVLDAGCGEGETIRRLGGILPPSVTGIDIGERAIACARQRVPEATLMCGSVYELPFEDRSFDLVLCLEVLEHLDQPEAALAELRRVARDQLVLSVPHEPWFRAGSLLRGKYLRTLGNHPEHVNHWNPASFDAFLSQDLEGVSVTRSFPWLLARGRR